MKKNNLKSFIIIICLLLVKILYASNPFYLYDKNLTHICEMPFSENNECQLHPETIKILNNLDDHVYITIFLDGDNIPEEFNILITSIKKMLSEFKLHSLEKFEYEFINPSSSIDKRKKQKTYNHIISLGINPIKIKKDNKETLVFPGAIINYQQKSSPMQIFRDAKINYQTVNTAINELEYNFIKTIHKLKEEKKIAFIQGNGELDSIQTHSIRNILSECYTIEEFNINNSKMENTNDIANKIKQISKYNSIIIAKPTENFNDLEKLIIDQYIMLGGSTIWLIDGTDANMNNFKKNQRFQINKKDINLDNFFDAYGIKINYNLIQDYESTKIPIKYNENIVYANWCFNPKIIPSRTHIINTKVDSIITNFVSSIETKETKLTTTILLSSSNNAKLLSFGEYVDLKVIKEKKEEYKLNNINQNIAVLIEGVFPSAYSNYQGNIELIKNSQPNKMIVISDGDIISNIPRFPIGYYHYNQSIFNGNRVFMLNAMHYLCNDSKLINIRNSKK